MKVLKKTMMICMAAVLSACSLSRIPDLAGEIIEDIVKEREPYPVTEGFRYYYDQLDDEQKMIYSCFLESTVNYSAAVEFIHDVSKEDLIVGLEAFKREHPEAFWMREYTMYSYGGSELVRSVEFNDECAYEEISDEIREQADYVVSEALAAGSAYDTVKYFYDWIIDTCEFDQDAENNQDIRSVFLTHASVCSGYAQAFQYLCNEAGIECVLVKGDADGSSHAWNAVWIDGEAYWVDTTWGDPVFEDDPSAEMKNYDFFLVNDELISRSHTADSSVSNDTIAVEDVFTVPVCSDDSLDYYILDGSFFSIYDRDSICAFIYENLEYDITEDISFRMGSQVEYERAYDDLFISEKYIEDILIDWYQCSLTYSVNTNEEAGVITLSVYIN